MTKIIESASRRLELAMGRPLSSMLKLVEATQDTIQEHLWKLFAYHSYRPTDMNGWKRSIDKHIPKLITYNVPKNNPNRRNLDRDQLIDKYVTELFENDDIDVLISIWNQEGYPFVELSESDRNRLRTLATKFVDAIDSGNTKLAIRSSDLL